MRKDSRKLPAVLHILPQYGVGGAELAARSAAEASADIHVLFLRRPAVSDAGCHPRIAHGASTCAFGPDALLAVLRTVRRVDPDVVVFSLWHTAVAFLFTRLFFPRKAVVVLLHSDRSVHILDRIWTEVAARLSTAVWADSTSSLNRVARTERSGQFRTVSFVPRRKGAVVGCDPGLKFICWARLTDAKNFPLSLELIARLRDEHPDVTYDIIGPDGGALGEIRAKIAELDLERQVRLLGPMTFSEIARRASGRSFFLQLSRYEGMAMSVVEAMQMGLVPVVTPVGEPARYCRHRENAVLFSDVEETARTIASVLGDRGLFEALRHKAIATWKNAPIYSEDFAAAARDLCARRRQRGTARWLLRG